MSQFVAFAVSVFVAFSIANAVGIYSSSHHVRIHMRPPTTAAPAGVSGGGPVGNVPQPIPSPEPKTQAGS
jgi:hypothetical protein